MRENQPRGIYSFSARRMKYELRSVESETIASRPRRLHRHHRLRRRVMRTRDGFFTARQNGTVVVEKTPLRNAAGMRGDIFAEDNARQLCA